MVFLDPFFNQKLYIETMEDKEPGSPEDKKISSGKTKKKKDKKEEQLKELSKLLEEKSCEAQENYQRFSEDLCGTGEFQKKG